MEKAQEEVQGSNQILILLSTCQHCLSSEQLRVLGAL